MEQRVKKGLAVTERHLKLCDDNLQLARVRSRNEFCITALSHIFLDTHEFPPNYLEEVMEKSRAEIKAMRDTMTLTDYY